MFGPSYLEIAIFVAVVLLIFSPTLRRLLRPITRRRPQRDDPPPQ